MNRTFRKELIKEAMAVLIAKAPYMEAVLDDPEAMRRVGRRTRSIARGAVAYADAVIAEMEKTPESA